jgi:hypothetical protein
MFFQRIFNFIFLSSLRSSIQIFRIKLFINFSQGSVYYPHFTCIYLTTLHYFRKNINSETSHCTDYEDCNLCSFSLCRLWRLLFVQHLTLQISSTSCLCLSLWHRNILLSILFQNIILCVVRNQDTKFYVFVAELLAELLMVFCRTQVR